MNNGARPDKPGIYWVSFNGEEHLAQFSGEGFFFRAGGVNFYLTSLPWCEVSELPTTADEIEMGGE